MMTVKMSGVYVTLRKTVLIAKTSVKNLVVALHHHPNPIQLRLHQVIVVVVRVVVGMDNLVRLQGVEHLLKQTAIL